MVFPLFLPVMFLTTLSLNGTQKRFASSITCGATPLQNGLNGIMSKPEKKQSFIQTSIHHLIHAAYAWIAALYPPALPVILIALVAKLIVIAQIPSFYLIDVGVEEGYHSDLPLLRHFNTFEDDEHGTYRWTRDRATIDVPGIGKRPVLVTLDFIPISSQVVEGGPKQMELWYQTPLSTFAVPASMSHITIPVDAQGRVHTLLVPPAMMPHGKLSLMIRTDTFTPPNDPRQLGTPLDRVTLATVASPSINMPDWQAVWKWELFIVLVWLLVVAASRDCRGVACYALTYPKRTKTTTEGASPFAIVFTSIAAIIVALAALLDPPRWAYGAQPAIVAAAASLGLVLLLQPVLPRLTRALHIAGNRQILGWLLMIVAVAFGIRFGGRLYPFSMWGDIGFHTNRFIESFGLGELFLVSRNRGVNFPYPPGPYLTLAPLILLHFDLRFVLQFVATLIDGLSAIAIWLMVAKTFNALPRRSHYQHTALLAAALYVLTAAGIMLTWWSFDTHIYAQAASVLLITALLFIGVDFLSSDHNWRGLASPNPSRPLNPSKLPTLSTWIMLGVLLNGVFLGHFGFLINTTLMGGLLFLLIWGASLRGHQWARQLRLPFTLTYIGAGLVAIAFFYSAYLSLFTYQLNAVSQGGLTGLAQRAPVSRSQIWDVLWHAGLIQHFGFFPLLLLPVGMAILWQMQSVSPAKIALRVLFVLMLCSVLVSSFFAILPFITLSTQSTRWMMFSAWAVAIGAAIAFRYIWHCGRAGRIMVIAMLGYVGWNTFVFWLEPMLWRIRPPEPF